MNLVEIVGLSFHRVPGNGSFTLEDINLAVSEGEMLCILGPNGAGKSTLLGCLLGLVEGWRGSIRLAGHDIRKLSRQAIAKLVAYLPQSSESIFDFEVRQMVLMGRKPHFNSLGTPSDKDRRCADLALERVGIVHLREKRFTELSGGEQRLVLIARALAQDTPIIVMDEPTTALDLRNQGRVLSLIRKLSRQGKAVIMSTHVPDQAFLLNCRVALMKAGRIWACGYASTTCCEAVMNSLYETSLRKLSDNRQEGLVAFLPDLETKECSE